MPEKGNTVIIQRSEQTHQLGIVGKRGIIVARDILNNVHVQINGYPNPFILSQDEVKKE